MKWGHDRFPGARGHSGLEPSRGGFVHQRQHSLIGSLELSYPIPLIDLVFVVTSIQLAKSRPSPPVRLVQSKAR